MKTIGIILLVISGLVFYGLQVHWDFDSWQMIDWIIIIFNITAGIYILNGKTEKE